MSYDTTQTTETQLWIDNDESLHRRKWFMFANLAKKVRKGIFDTKKAEKLFRYLCDEAARTYRKEIGQPLDMKDRRQAEKDLVTDFLSHSRLDSFPADLEANIKPPMAPMTTRRMIAERAAHKPRVELWGRLAGFVGGVRRQRFGELLIGSLFKFPEDPEDAMLIKTGPTTYKCLEGSGRGTLNHSEPGVVVIQHNDPQRALREQLSGEPLSGAGKHDPDGQTPLMIESSPPPASAIRAYAKKRARKGGK